jgi:hypothetical protein
MTSVSTADINNSIVIFHNLVRKIEQSEVNFTIIKKYLVETNEYLQQFPDLPQLNMKWLDTKKFWINNVRALLNEYIVNISPLISGDQCQLHSLLTLPEKFSLKCDYAQQCR